MKAIGLTEFGGPEVLKVVDLPEPEPGPGEVRIRVHAVAVNPTNITLAILQADDHPARRGRKRASVQVTVPAQAAELIDRLRVTGVTLIYDQVTRALRTSTTDAVTVTAGWCRYQTTGTRKPGRRPNHQPEHPPRPEAGPG
jgi:hypothetical protein